MFSNTDINMYHFLQHVVSNTDFKISKNIPSKFLRKKYHMIILALIITHVIFVNSNFMRRYVCEKQKCYQNL